MGKIKLSPKFIAFLKNTNFTFEFLESCTYAGKSTVGIIKALFTIADSPKKFHVIAGLDLGVIERNLINKDCGLLDVFGDLAQYFPNGYKKISLPHILYHAPDGDKIIYLVGYADKARWRKVLGSQFGVIFIDEANQADLAFIQEITMRCDKAIFTQNPDDPNLDWYKQYVNHSRPLEHYKKDYPAELLGMLNEDEKAGWIHWYFTFDDNASLTPEKKHRIIDAVPVGTKQYFTKILGLRRKATGLVFLNFDRKKHVITKQEAKQKNFITFTAGLDTAYSSNSADTIAMTFVGITKDREAIVLDEKVYNNANLDTPIAPSDTVKNFIDFLERNKKEWGLARNVFIDSADQATITELNKYKRNHTCIYVFNGAYKKVQIIDRINLQLGWLHTAHYKVVDTCKEHIRELEVYSWLEDKDNVPEDSNDHTINSVQYAFIPYIKSIGIPVTEQVDRPIVFDPRLR